MPKRIKGVTGLIVLFILIAGGIQACTHEHNWIDATCTEPKTCSSCNKTEGDPLGHNYQGASCTFRGTCTRCGEIGGGYIPHEWVDATCTEAEHCAMCGENRRWDSFPLGHHWESATCTAPKTCTRCGATEGTPQHNFISSSWETTIEPTCQTEGEESRACQNCGEIETRVIPTIAHKSGDWQISQEATASSPGIKIKSCEMCGTEMSHMEYTLPAPNMSSNSGGSTGGSRNTGGNGGSGGSSGNSNNFNTYDNPDQQNTAATYVLNTNTMKFHYPSCRYVSKIASKNYATSSQSRSTLISRGYSPCGHCKP